MNNPMNYSSTDASLDRPDVITGARSPSPRNPRLRTRQPYGPTTQEAML